MVCKIKHRKTQTSVETRLLYRHQSDTNLQSVQARICFVLVVNQRACKMELVN